jgi:hypothetical protein
MKPSGVEAALAAIEQRRSQAMEKRRQVELALKQQRFEATRARQQYDAMDPDNRLVFGRSGMPAAVHMSNLGFRTVQKNATVYASWDLSGESSGESRLKA